MLTNATALIWLVYGIAALVALLSLLLSLALGARDVGFGVTAAVVCGALTTGIVLLGNSVHFTASEQAALHSERSAALLDTFEQRAGECAEQANTAVNDGQQLTLESTSAHPGNGERTLRRVNSQYAAGVRCLLSAVRQVLPGPPVTRYWHLLDQEEEADDGLFCLDNHSAAPPEEVLSLLDTEIDLWDGDTVLPLAYIQAVTAEPAASTAASAFRYLTDPARFPVDLDRLYPFFSSAGASDAWTAYHPDTAEFTVNRPTVAQLASYCDTLT